ncbi:MAG TPA: hypothetical protein VN643_16875 [Pyrinomonadaceae bacterium]|nr:hypothetical protein [Pyrinomonadaceae bacterium]
MAVFLVACVTGVTIAVLWGTLRGRLVRAPSKLVTTESGRRDPKNDSGRDWQRIDMDGKVTFLVPPELSPAFKRWKPLSRLFVKEGNLWFSIYQRKGPEECEYYKLGASQGSRFEDFFIDGQKALLERREEIPWDIDQDKPVLKGLVICVPDFSNGERGFVLVGKYKSDQDYEILKRIVESVKFSSK